MGQVKGCINPDCKAYHKTTFKSKEEFCSLCGQPLAAICKHKGCFKQLPVGNKSKLCAFHEAEREERKEKVADGFKKFGTGALAFAGTVVSVGKVVVDMAKKK